MSYGISSGVNDRIKRQQEIFDVEDELEGGDIRDLVAEACPVPHPKILARLQKDWERGPDFSFRLPWQSRTNFDKYNEGYNEQNVMFFARILTMLAELGILPPAQVQTQGVGGSKGVGGVLPTNFDGPLQITPDVPASTPTFNVAHDEKEAKENALSDGPGSLSEASRAQMIDVLRFGRNQVQALIDHVHANPTGDRVEDSKRQADVLQITALVLENETLQQEARQLREQKEAIERQELIRAEFMSDEFVSLYDELELEVDRQQMLQNRSRIRDLDSTMWLLKDRMDAKESQMIELQERLQRRRDASIVLPRVVWNLQHEREAALIPGNNYADQLGTDFDDGDVIPDVQTTSRMRRMRTWAEGIRRRLPHSRLTRRQQEVVELILPPPVEVEYKDDDIENEVWVADHPEVAEWERYLGTGGMWRRCRLLKLIALFLAVPVAVAIPTVLLHRNESQTVDDELVQLFLTLDEKTHWFRQLPLRAWQRIIIITPREENYLLLQQVTDLQLHFPSDEFVLWQIDFCLFGENKNEERALQWFNQVTKPDVSYRTKHATELTAIATNIKDKYLLDAFEYCFVCRANDSALNVISAFYQAMPAIAKTHPLFMVATEAKSQISHDLLFPTRGVNKYEALVNAFSDVLKNQTQPYFSDWIHEMKLRYKASKFYERLPEEAFDNFLQELSVHSQKYPHDAKDIVGDFLNRFTTKTAELPFLIATNELKWDEDIYQPTTQLLQEMRAYHNEGDFDALSYDVFNKHWDKRSAKTEYQSFEEAVTFLDLDTPTKYMLFVLLGSIDNGIVTFTQNAMKDVAESSDEFPDVLPSVSLYKQREVDNIQMLDQNRRISSTNRHILFTTQNQGYTLAETPFLRTSKYVLMKVGLVSFFMVTTEGNQQYANLVTVTSPQNALPTDETQVQREFDVEIYRKPIEESNNGVVLTNSTQGSLAAHIVALGAFVALSSQVTGGKGPTITFLLAGWEGLTSVVFPTLAYSGEFLGYVKDATIPYVVPVVSGLLPKLQDLTFNKAAMLAVFGTSWWYGSNATLTTIDKVADSAVKISKVAAQSGMGLAAVVLSGVVLFVLVDNVSTRGKKRKLF